MSEHFRHQKLPTDKQTIRLIKIEEGEVDEQIACTLRHVEPSSEEIAYSALSYVWGDDSPTKEIRLRSDNSKAWYKFALHENLWRFLDFARTQIRRNQGHFDCWYWTDCICLDQVNDDEKKHWIPQMGKIYFYAERVVAWLDLELDVGDQLRPARDELDKMGRHDKLGHSRLLQSEVPREAAEAIREAKYWSRIWIMQEVVSAKLVVCVVGNVEVDNITLGRMVDFPENHHARVWERLQRDMNFDPCWWTKHGMDSSIMIPWSEHERLKKVDLWQLLSLVTTDEYSSTKPLDLVYGILGLAATNPDGTNPVQHIKVGYERSSVHVIMDALLESYPIDTLHWEDQRFSRAIELLLREVHNQPKSISVFEALEEYMEKTESERHRNLTRLLLRSCDAMFSVFGTTALPRGVFCEQDTFCNLLGKLKDHPGLESYRGFNSLKGSGANASRVWTIQHNAIMLGIALVLETYHEAEPGHVFDSWIAHRQQSALNPTGIWWCGVCLPSKHHPKHRLQLSRGEHVELDPSQWMKLYEENRRKKKEREAQGIRFMVSTSSQSLSQQLHEACACQKACISRKCDGSVMAFELLEAGFCLELRNIKQLEKKLEIHIRLSPPEANEDLDRGEAVRKSHHRALTWSWASCELLPQSAFSRRSGRLLVTNDYATRSKSLAAVRILDVMWQCEGGNRFGSLSEASLTVLGRPLRGFAYSGGKAPAFDEAWVTMDEDIEELPALKPNKAEGRQASQTQRFVVVRGKTKSGEWAEMVSQVIADTSDQKVEGYVHLLPVAENWVVGGGDRLFCLVLRETSSGIFERIGSSLSRSCYVIKARERKMILV